MEEQSPGAREYLEGVRDAAAERKPWGLSTPMLFGCAWAKRSSGTLWAQRWIPTPGLQGAGMRSHVTILTQLG